VEPRGAIGTYGGRYTLHVSSQNIHGNRDIADAVKATQLSGPTSGNRIWQAMRQAGRLSSRISPGEAASARKTRRAP
jgi:hypothetical protein